jgi:phosphoadenosine phosphosulfate reductase
MKGYGYEHRTRNNDTEQRFVDSDMLIEETLFGKIDKVQVAIDRLRCFEPPEGYYVAFSGGKDSVVILDLVKKSGVKFDAHYNITGIDPPELYYFIRDQHPEVQRHRPEMTMWALIVKMMSPPLPQSRYCCEHLKERGGFDRRVITGVRWEESTRRGKRKMVDVCFRNSRKTYVHPIIDWSVHDVWEYIQTNDIPYCSLYKEGFTRLGCIGCCMASAKERRRQFDRYPRIERLYRKSFHNASRRREERIIQDPVWGESHISRMMGNSGDAMFDWWMEDKHTKGDPDQTIIFE